MINERVVVDGSNIATEGRSLPSLAQLDEAVRALQAEHPDALTTVVVDATFGHRIADDEKDAYEEAVLAGELVTPPAGAIGRGDAFVLTIANRAGATVFSNDSFQEFHGEYSWLFDEGRLIGGKPVPGVGWVFVLRAPVRGPISRRSQREAKDRGPRTAVRKASASAGKAVKAPAAKATRATKATKAAKSTKAAKTGATPWAAAADEAGGSRPKIGATKATGASGRGRGRSAQAPAADEPIAASAPSEPRRRSRSRRQDNADVSPPPTAPAADAEANGWAGSTALGEDKGRGRRRRRGGKVPNAVNEPVPFLEFVSVHPVGTVVEGIVDRFSSHGAYVVIGEAQCYLPLRAMADPPPKSAREVLKVGDTRSFVVEAFDSPRRSIDLAIPGLALSAPPLEGDAIQPRAGRADQSRSPEETSTMAPATKKRAPARKTASKKTAAKKAPAKRAPAKKAVAKKTAAKKAPAKRAPAKKAVAKKAAAKKAPAKRAPAKKAPAKKAVAKRSAAKRAPAKRSAAKKTVAKRAPAKKAVAKKAPAKKAGAKRPAAKKTVAKKATPRKASPRKTTARRRTSSASS
jgi:Histone H1-like nucleoprotein HC2/S1 RNA binding domain/Zc3h12a-like Ribonuclease NYN domain